MALCFLGSPARAASQQPFRVGPPADWVKPLSLPAKPGASSPGAEAAGTLYLLSDEQVRVTDKTVQRYLHTAHQVLSTGGVEDASNVTTTFDPSYQRLTLHGVWRIRDGQRQDVLRPAELKVIQQENELQLRLYNGTLSVVAFLRDVRVGDIIEVAYTLEGSNSVFGGRFADTVDTSFGVPVVHWRYRLLWPEKRSLFMRDHGNVEARRTESLRDGVRELSWERQDAPRVERDDAVPAWHDVYPWIQLSEYETWGEVARWASSLFQVTTRSKELEQQVQLLAKEPSTEARFLAALRFVQDEVRYLGIELGPNTHQPFPPHEVLTRRFGDCKDKSLLLVTLLAGLGIEARPALVNTYLEHGLDAWHPTSRAFDHVIVRATVDGREYWVDPTSTLERGPLAGYAPPEFARALVVDPATTALVEIPRPQLNEPTTVVEETYHAMDRWKEGTLRVVTTRTGSDANRMRRELATTSMADLSRSYLNFYARVDPKIRQGSPMAVEDDEKRNVLILREHYVIDRFWANGGRRDFEGAFIETQLWEPAITRRTMPLAIQHPVHLLHRITLHGPDTLDVRSSHSSVMGPAFRVDFGVEPRGSRLVLDYRYRSLASVVEPQRIEEHLKAVRSTRDQIGYWVKLGTTANPGVTRGEYDSLGCVAVSVVLLVCLAFVVLPRSPRALWGQLRARLRKRAFVRKLVSSAGDTAQSAIPISGPEALRASLRKQRCDCGAGGPDPLAPLRHEAIVFGERHLTLVQWRCPSCSQERRVYFEDTVSRAA
ncbi:DUF3857 domain-containing protein [Hyalangium rubrum]|uniref:DUF3857 domain-containing protein n=1 Tax=Hyalangium rubrum TaxID=3103134 RepID=A0ABU5HGM6_9BACT|nr:DUF3857 domain-containing protein [Hyalangium sp. s54d21]MDY7232609.1 DUF3857 domain-containing protein [Hyalangium sp. s54d21]